jgi:antitoxin component YwqK of YwqJK toxin-antitoxin module
MHRLIPFLFFFSCLVSFGQNSLLSTAFTWFGKGDRTSIDSYLKGNSYQFIGEKDSTPFHVVNYSLVKTENGTQPFVTALLSDSALEFISLDTYGHRTDISVLKSARFKSIGTDINGNFITTTYDNGTFLIHEDYEAVGNPLGKGEIAYFRYRILRKYGPFDQLNGEKIRVTENGEKVSENYKNGFLDGQRTIYFPDGSVKRTENYRAGRLNGVASDYDPEGKIIHSSTHSYHWKYGVEKWYNRDGKLVKTLQWQRDIPVGTEKQTFNGTTIGSIPYVKGMKHGLAKVPVYYDESIEVKYPLDTLNDEPLGIETVHFHQGLKNGKAVCTHFNNSDTMYVAYYKAGQLDSAFTRYGQDGVLYNTAYLNGLENGARVYHIPSGPLKDSIHLIAHYKNGKLDGQVIQYYQKRKDAILEDADPGYRLPGSGSDHPKILPGEWIPKYYSETYRDGMRNGPYSLQRDSMNYYQGNYLNGQLDGAFESAMVLGEKWIKISGRFQNGFKTGKWTTNHVFDSMVVTEDFEQNRKHGSTVTRISGFKTEERLYRNDTLFLVRFDKRNSDFDLYYLEFLKKTDLAVFSYKTQKGDSSSEFSYLIEVDHYPGKKDTLLSVMLSSFKNHKAEMSQNLHGLFHIVTPGYEESGNYKHGKLMGNILIKHLDATVFENILYKDGVAETREYSQFMTHEPYSGTFISATSREQISVKDGLRHGWCVEYDASGKEIRRTKYKYGILKKTVSL